MDLSEHYVAGRLTLDELKERLGAVFAAKTYGQLIRIMADLPPLRRHPWLTGPPGAWGRAPDWTAGMAGGSWAATPPFAPGLRPRNQESRPATPDRAGRLAALCLLLLAMLIWLFTALLFARHGIYHQGSPPMPSMPFGQ